MAVAIVTDATGTPTSAYVKGLGQAGTLSLGLGTNGLRAVTPVGSKVLQNVNLTPNFVFKSPFVSETLNDELENNSDLLMTNGSGVLEYDFNFNVSNTPWIEHPGNLFAGLQPIVGKGFSSPTHLCWQSGKNAPIPTFPSGCNGTWSAAEVDPLTGGFYAFVPISPAANFGTLYYQSGTSKAKIAWFGTPK